MSRQKCPLAVIGAHSHAVSRRKCPLGDDKRQLTRERSAQSSRRSLIAKQLGPIGVRRGGYFCRQMGWGGTRRVNSSASPSSNVRSGPLLGADWCGWSRY